MKNEYQIIISDCVERLYEVLKNAVNDELNNDSTMDDAIPLIDHFGREIRWFFEKALMDKAAACLKELDARFGNESSV